MSFEDGTQSPLYQCQWQRQHTKYTTNREISKNFNNQVVFSGEKERFITVKLSYAILRCLHSDLLTFGKLVLVCMHMLHCNDVHIKSVLVAWNCTGVVSLCGRQNVCIFFLYLIFLIDPLDN